MKKRGIVFNARTYRALIDAYARVGEFEKVQEVRQVCGGRRRAGLPPGAPVGAATNTEAVRPERCCPGKCWNGRTPQEEGGGVPPGPPPLPQTKVTIVGRSDIYKKENLIGPFLVHKLLGPPPPSFSLLPRGGGAAAAAAGAVAIRGWRPTDGALRPLEGASGPFQSSHPASPTDSTWRMPLPLSHATRISADTLGRIPHGARLTRT